MRTIYMEGMRPPRISGAITMLITPFDNDKLDRVGLMALVEWQIRSGIDGLVACGLAGEGPVLTPAERAEIITTCIEIAEGKIPVIAATGTNDTATTIEETRQAKSLGADAALVTLPYYSKPGQKGIIGHFETLAAAVDMPLIIHNLPGHTAIDLAPATAKHLAAIPNVIGLADGTGDISRISAWRHELPRRCALFSAHDATSPSFTFAGGQGTISTASNVAPRLVSAMQHASSAGNLPAALILLERLHPLFRALARESEPATIKHALSILEKIKADVRLPLAGVEAETDAAIREALADLRAECHSPHEQYAMAKRAI